MSAGSQPISSQRFATALLTVPLSTLHSTAAEIRNSLAHLHSSNEQLEPHAQRGDRTCREAIEENMTTMDRMNGRLQLLKQEVLKRGMPWVESNDDQSVSCKQQDGDDQNEDDGIHL